MKKFAFSLFATVLLAGSLVAQSSVWKVTKGDSTLYLGGTCHVLRPTDLPLPAEFDQAYAAAQILVFETDLARASSPEMQQIVMQRGLFTAGKTLDQVLTPEAWAELGKYCTQRGLPVERMRQMRPWLVVVMMAAMELQKLGVSPQGVDQIYFQRAKADGKTIGELESFERQVDFITGMAADRPSDLIANSLADLEKLPQEINDLLAAWRKGDLAALQRIMNDEMRTKYPELFQKLLVARNDAWLPVIEKMHGTPEIEFILAGVGHMSGPEGLIARLRERGYQVEPVVATPPETKK